jgi:hypothetical protein
VAKAFLYINAFEFVKIIEIFYVHAVSNDACGVIDTACTVHAMSMTPLAKYDTTCTNDERFEPWQSLKGISSENKYVRQLSYPTTRKNFFHAIFVIGTACTIFASKNRSYLGEYEVEFKKPTRNSGPQGVLIDGKKRGSKISWHCPSNSVQYPGTE